MITELRLTAYLAAAVDDDDLAAARDEVAAHGADLAGDGTAVVTASARLDDAERFAEVAGAVAERLRPERMLLEAGPELWTEAVPSREDLAAYRFGAYAGVALPAAQASWYRAYLRACDLRLDERAAGRLALFSNGVLGGPAGELFVPWRGGHRYEVEAAWLERLPRASRSSAADAGDPRAPVERRAFACDAGDDERGWLQRLRAELEPAGLAPAALPICAAVYVLPLLAHPERARPAVGAARYERAAALAQAIVADPFEDLRPERLQVLELAWLDAVRFAAAGDAPADMLLSVDGGEVIALASSARRGEADLLDAVARACA